MAAPNPKFAAGSTVVFLDRFGQTSEGQVVGEPWGDQIVGEPMSDGDEWWYEVVDLNTPDGDRYERAESDLKQAT
jgi:hypothetical protein